MYVVDKSTNGRRKAKKLDSCLELSQNAKHVMVLDNHGKKIINDVDIKTFKLKFG